MTSPYSFSITDQTQIRASINSERERQKIMRRAFDAVEGIFPDPIRVSSVADDNIKVNVLRPAVTILVNYLFGTPPTYELPKEDPQEIATGEESPKEVWL